MSNMRHKIKMEGQTTTYLTMTLKVPSMGHRHAAINTSINPKTDLLANAQSS